MRPSRGRQTLSAATALVAVLVAPTLSQAPDLDVTTALLGIGGFGDVGRVEADYERLSPNNTLGASVRFVWEDRPGDPDWWSIRMGLPETTRPWDTLAFDIYVVETDEEARVSILLVESDDDRWVALGTFFHDLAPGQWSHFEVHRDSMAPWLIGDGVAEWEQVRTLAIEPGGGRATFLIDGLRLLGPDGYEVEILSSEDDGFAVLDPPQSIAPAPPPGVCWFPFDASRLGIPDYLDTPRRLAEVVGPVGTPISGFSAEIPTYAQALADRDVASMYYSSFSSGYAKYLTRRGAWDVNADGATMNRLHPTQTNWDGQHTIALAHPTVTEAVRAKIDALLAAGIGVWMVVDYTFPWFDTWWGYSDAMIQAYRADLAGTDEGLTIVEDGAERAIGFQDYFREYNGFALTPADLRLSDWSEYTPPRPSDALGPDGEKLATVFLMLRSYEWLKLPDRAGRYMVEGGGEPLWIVPNPEDSYGSSDYVYLLRSQGVGNLLPEWFGCIGWAAEAGYASLPYLREVADRAGSRLSIIQETGAGGHAAPYLDWRVAASGVYALTAAGQLDDFDNDFIDEQPFGAMADPTGNPYHFARFRDAVGKALAFGRARGDGVVRPASNVLCIDERPPAKATASLFFGLSREHSLALGLARGHVLFDLRDSLGLGEVLDRYGAVFYSPRAPRVGDVDLLAAWLREAPGRTLVTHSYVPTRDCAGFFHQDRSARLGDSDGGHRLGLGAIHATDATVCQVTRAVPPWDQVLPVGTRLDLSEPLTTCQDGEALVETDAGPLVTRSRVGQGTVIYLHWVPGAAAEPQGLDAEVTVLLASSLPVGTTCRADVDTAVQVFESPEQRVVLAWDVPTMEDWSFEYRPGIPPLQYEAQGVERWVELPVEPGDWLIYDLWGDALERRATDGEPLRLCLRDAVVAQWHIGRDTPVFRGHLEDVRSMRARMTDLGFDGQ